MLPIFGVPMLERVMANLARHGVTDAVLSLGYLPDRFIEAYPEHTVAGVRVRYAVEPSPLDTAGAIRFAATFAEIDDTFIVVNGDVITDLDVSRLVAFHRERGAEATIALYPVDDPSRFGVVPTDDEGRVIAFVEKPPRDEAPTNLINAGTYVMEPSVISRIEPDVKVSVERVTFPELAAQGRLFALADDAYWLDTGTPQAYLQAHRDVLDGTRVLALTPAATGQNWIHDAATVHQSASLTFASIDRDVHVGDGVTLVNVVVMAGAVIGPRATLEDCIIGPGAAIGEGATLRATCVIGHGVSVPARSILSGDVRLGGPVA
jgi:mannose-1-phosphate guanylyltransferase